MELEHWMRAGRCMENNARNYVIGTPHITEDTRQEICRILAWDFKQLEQGVYDFVGHTGSFHPLKSSREKLAGESMPVKAVTLPEFRF